MMFIRGAMDGASGGDARAWLLPALVRWRGPVALAGVAGLHRNGAVMVALAVPVVIGLVVLLRTIDTLLAAV